MAVLPPEGRAALEGELGEAQRRGYVGPGDLGPHIEHALRYAAALGSSPDRALDLGSGGGLPGLVLALVWPDARWVLLEASANRTGFLRAATDRLGLSSRVEVLHRRAEEAGRDPRWRGRFDVVVSRSFGPPAVVAECAAPFLVVGGRLVVSEPPPPAGGRWAEGGLAELGLQADPAPFGGLACFRQVARCPERFPRRPAAMRKRPLF